ncbi:MAG: FAD-dependent oxidoreductase [Vicinamibacterales bacterium]
MSRDLSRLVGVRHDLLVIGGGIHGLFAAYDAAQRGLSVALVERADFGSGLSFNHQRTLHGGLRALGTGHVQKARRQIAERRAWALMAPHLIRPLPFMVGTYAGVAQSRWLIAAGFKAYDLIGRRRNAGLPAELVLPLTRMVSKTEAIRLFAGTSARGLTGAGVWHDYQTIHPDRTTWSVALAAGAAGAVLCNYTEAIAPLLEGNRVAGARVRDALTGQTSDVLARATLICAGSALGDVMANFGATGAPPLVRAMNLLIDRPGGELAVAVRGRAGRMLTAVPWRGFVLVGTHQSRDLVDASDPAPGPVQVAEAISEVNQAFPSFAVRADDIRLVHHGLTPAVRRAGVADLMPESHVTRHNGAGRPGLLSIVGVKFTTARHTAEAAVDAVYGELGLTPRPPSRTGQVALPYAIAPATAVTIAAQLADRHPALDPADAVHLVDWYGSEAPAVALVASERGLLNRLSSSSPVMAGEIVYAVTHGQALRLSDAVLRRTLLGSTGHPGREALTRAADLMGSLLGWSAQQQLEETAAVERRYPLTRAVQ